MLRGINDSLASLVKIIKFDLIDTGIYRQTSFKSVELTLETVETWDTKFWVDASETDGVLRATAQVPKDELEITIEEQAVFALHQLTEHFNLDAQVFKDRAHRVRSILDIRRKESTTDYAAEAEAKTEENLGPYQSNIPTLIPVNHDDGDFGYARSIGTYGDGNQFWGRVGAQMEQPTEPGLDDWEKRKRWYGILHKFDREGSHIGMACKFTGTTGDGEGAACQAGLTFMQECLKELGPIRYGDIKIRLFSVEFDGFVFGLIDTSDHESGDSATMEPGFLTFYPPWDGNYDT